MPQERILKVKSIFILVLILLSFWGCQPPAPEPITIRMVAGAIGKEFEVLEAQVAQFEAQHPNIQVQLLDLPESTSDRHAAYIERFKQQDPTIDIYMIDIIWVPEFGAAGWTIPLNQYIAAENIDMDEFLRGPVQGNTWNGQLVSMPWFTDAGLLYYRQDLVAKYGFAGPPQTWSQLKRMAETIVDGEGTASPDMVGFVFQGREYEGLVTNYLEYVWGNDAAVLNNTSDQVVLNSPKAVEALEILVSMKAIAPPGVTSFQEADGLNYFKSGNAVFMRNWPFAWAVLNDDSSHVKGKVGIAPIPLGPSGTDHASTLGGWQLGISAFSEHPDEAFQLIAFLTSLEQQSYKAIHAGQPPTLRAAYRDPDVLAANPYLEELFTVLVDARPRPVHPRYAEISKVIQQQVRLTLTGQQDAATATTKMAQAIQAIVSAPSEKANQ